MLRYMIVYARYYATSAAHVSADMLRHAPRYDIVCRYVAALR